MPQKSRPQLIPQDRRCQDCDERRRYPGSLRCGRCSKRWIEARRERRANTDEAAAIIDRKLQEWEEQQRAAQLREAARGTPPPPVLYTRVVNHEEFEVIYDGRAR
jgi:hypothetical protein